MNAATLDSERSRSEQLPLCAGMSLVLSKDSETSATTVLGDKMNELAAAEKQLELSIVMPCLNERETVGVCVRKALASLSGAGVRGEVIIGDNGSTDGSVEIAESEGARVIHVADKGYGSALKGGILAARGEYVLMGDSDDSYDFGHIMRFLDQLRAGSDLVMGNRFRGGIAKNAMPPLHRYLGNPVLTGIGRLLFHSPCEDFHCGLRGFRKDSFLRMDIRSTGMEFASEMVVKASLLRMKVSEVPTTLAPDGRSRPPHLRTWRDGWRHLRFLLMYSPRWLFLYPGNCFDPAGVGGVCLALAGAACGSWHWIRCAYASLRIRFGSAWLSACCVRLVHQDIRHLRRPAARRSAPESHLPLHYAGNRPGCRRPADSFGNWWFGLCRLRLGKGEFRSSGSRTYATRCHARGFLSDLGCADRLQ